MGVGLVMGLGLVFEGEPSARFFLFTKWLGVGLVMGVGLVLGVGPVMGVGLVFEGGFRPPYLQSLKGWMLDF